MTVDFWHLRATVFTVFYFLSYRMWKNSCQQNEHCHAVNTYIVQVLQRRFAQEESKVYLAGPGQAHRSPLVYDLCGRLILVVCAVETAMQDSFFGGKKRDEKESFATIVGASYRASGDSPPAPARTGVWRLYQLTLSSSVRPITPLHVGLRPRG